MHAHHIADVQNSLDFNSIMLGLLMKDLQVFSAVDTVDDGQWTIQTPFYFVTNLFAELILRQIYTNER